MNKKERKAYDKTYYQRPEVKAHRKAYDKECQINSLLSKEEQNRFKLSIQKEIFNTIKDEERLLIDKPQPQPKPKEKKSCQKQEKIK